MFGKSLLSANAALLVLGSAAFAAQQAPQQGSMPDIAAAMLKVAYESGDPAEIAAVAKAVKAVFPDYADIIAEDAETQIAALKPAAKEETNKDAVDAPPSGGLLAMKPWDGKFSASAVISSGNSENTAVGIALDAARIAGNFKHNIKGYLDLGESNGVTNQKRWGASYKLDYNFTDRSYAYGRFSYDEDQFSGFDYRLFAGAGLGHYFVKSEAFTWKAEGGPGFRYSPIDLTREIKKEFAAYGATEIDWLIREELKFEQDFNVTWTSPTTTFQSVTSLSTKIWGDLATGLSFEYRYETDPPPGRENTDTIAKASLIYGF